MVAVVGVYNGIVSSERLAYDRIATNTIDKNTKAAKMSERWLLGVKSSCSLEKICEGIPQTSMDDTSRKNVCIDKNDVQKRTYFKKLCV